MATCHLSFLSNRKTATAESASGSRATLSIGEGQLAGPPCVSTPPAGGGLIPSSVFIILIAAAPRPTPRAS